jgi:hypothetical protein
MKRGSNEPLAKRLSMSKDTTGYKNHGVANSHEDSSFVTLGKIMDAARSLWPARGANLESADTFLHVTTLQ